MKTENSSNKRERMTDEQAYEQRLLDVLSYHQPGEASQINNQDAKFCIVNGNAKNISWAKAGDELNEALERIYKDNSEDCFVSISEFKGEKLNENYVASIKIFYIKLRKTEKFNPSTIDEGQNIILEYCREHGIPTPTVIIYDGNEYILKWILREPLNGIFSLKLWRTVQKFLAERFFCLLDNRFYFNDGHSPKEKFVEAHSHETAMLRVPGFLKTYQTQGADLFSPKQEVRVIFNSGIAYTTGEIALKLYLSTWEIEQYRDAKEWARGYMPKKSPSKKKDQPAEALPSAAIQPLDETLTESMKAALITHHVPREQATFIYVQRKNIEKHSRTDRTCFYDSYSVAELERFLRRTDINICDFWMTAAEYKWGFRKLKEKTIHRTRENGERYEEVRRQLPKREKWIEAIQLNFLHLNFRKSELGYIPTIEQAIELIYARCSELNLPKPVIVDTGDNCETLELRWPWLNAMENCGERNDLRIKYPRFNSKFDEMQRELFRLFWYFGADEKKISATSMLCVVGTPNTKTGNIRRIVGDADEILTYQDFAKRLGLNFDKANEDRKERAYTIERPEQPQQQPKHEESAKIKTRAPLEVTATLNRAVEVVNPESPIFKIAADLANYADFEIVMTKENSQNHYEADTYEEPDESQAKVEEVKAPQAQENKPCQPVTNAENLSNNTLDLLRLHSGGNYWVCLCTENKASKGQRGLWREYWTPASRVLEALSTLKLKVPDFEEFNIYVSQLEFSEMRRQVEKVAAFRACFVDIDGKIAGGDLTAEEWKNLILKYCSDKKLPTPSEMVFSGNGVHVKYFFTRLMTVKEFSRWESLERKLYWIFKEIGADSHSTDGARVLRVEGTKNCKPDTKDREVRVIFTGDDYDFEKFAQEIETLLPDEIKISEPKQSSKSKPKASKVKSEKQTSEPTTEELKPASSQSVRQPSDEEQALSTFEDWEDANKTWFYVLNATTNKNEWVARSDLMSYLNKQDKTHRLKCSVVEYTPAKKREDRPKYIENIFFSHVVLSKRPGVALEVQIAEIMERCRQYRGVGIPEPNRILEDGNKLIAIWRYSKESSGQELPGRALSRWKASQECLNHYFDAIDVSLAQKSTMLLPLSGFSSVNVVYENPALKYLFDTVASAVLPFSQKEVAENKAEKQNRPRRSIALEDLTAEYVARRDAEGRKSRFNPALKIFNDIVRLLKIRALNGVDDEVPEGRRELSVFWALNFAVQAGLVKGEGTEDFNELAQRLINFCGKSFTFDCTPNVMTTLRRKFAEGKEVYRPKKKTLISRLSITAEEQAELDILKEDAPKSPKRKKIPAWEILGVSKATYYRREKKAKEIAEKLREIYAQYLTILWIRDKALQAQAYVKFLRLVRLKNSAYYEGGGEKRRDARRESHGCSGRFGLGRDVRGLGRDVRLLRLNCHGRRICSIRIWRYGGNSCSYVCYPVNYERPPPIGMGCFFCGYVRLLVVGLGQFRCLDGYEGLLRLGQGAVFEGNMEVIF